MITTPCVVQVFIILHYIQCSVMTQSQTPTVNEAVAFIRIIADESDTDELHPENYDWYEVRRYVLALKQQMRSSSDSDLSERCQTLRTETTLSPREAEVVALKEHGLTHNAIATYYGVVDKGTTNDEQYPLSISTVDEYSRRAGEKYDTAMRTVEELEEAYGPNKPL